MEKKKNFGKRPVDRKPKSLKGQVFFEPPKRREVVKSSDQDTANAWVGLGPNARQRGGLPKIRK